MTQALKNTQAIALVDTLGSAHSADGQYTTKGQSADELGGLTADENIFTKKFETVKERVAALHDELAGQVEGLADDENWLNYLNTMSKFHRYSMGNMMLIAMQRPDATRVAGFKDWKKFGRSVKKGEKGIVVIAPAMGWRTEEDENGNEKKTRKVVGFTTRAVFDIAQTEGEPLPERHAELTEEPPAGFIDNLEASIQAAGFSVRYADIPGSKQGFTDPQTMEVVIDSKLNPAERATVLAHERGHIACGHMDRVEEYHSSHGARGNMEVEAESFAYVLARANGMSVAIGGASATYVAGWSQADPASIKKSGDLVAKAVHTVLTDSVFAPAVEMEDEAEAA